MREQSTGFLETNASFVAVAEPSVLKALDRVVACEECSDSAFRSFGSVLSITLGAARPVADFAMGMPAFCPNCSAPVTENTLVRFDGDEGEGGEETRDYFHGAIPAYSPWWNPAETLAPMTLEEDAVEHVGEFTGIVRH